MANSPSRLLVLVVPALLAPALAAAQSPAPPLWPGPWEVTVFAGYRIEGNIRTKASPEVPVIDLDDAATYGLALDWQIDRFGELEVQYSYTNSPATVMAVTDGVSLRGPGYDMAIHDVTFGFIGNFTPPDRMLRPYLGLGIGFSVLDPSNTLPSTTKLTFAVSGGLRAYFSSRFGLRFEARWVPVYLFSTGPGGCDWYWFGCSSRQTGHVIQQADFRLGASFRF